MHPEIIHIGGEEKQSDPTEIEVVVDINSLELVSEK